METIMTQTPSWTWAIPLIVSIIALFGVMTTLIMQWRNFNKQLRSAHALKISEMRQAWINNLRDAMATFQSFGVTPNLNQLEQREWYEAGTKIELLMNPLDEDYSNLQETMYAYFNARDITEKYLANTPYIQTCQRILKREWETIKIEINNSR